MESKQCVRCRSEFECKPENIGECQCSRIQLNDDERAFIKSAFEGCLCLTCLQELKREFYISQLYATIKYTRLD